MNDQSTYELYLNILHAICHETTVCGPQEAFDKLIEYGWIEQRVTYVMKDSSGRRLSRCYTVTAQGIRVLTPRENRAVNFTHEPSVPYTTTPDGKQVCIFMDVLASPTNFFLTADGKQICLLSDYLDGTEAPQPA